MRFLFGRPKLRQHINPDGTPGGMVPESAFVASDAFIGATAVVMPGAEVESRQRIESGEIYTRDGVKIRFGPPYPD